MPSAYGIPLAEEYPSAGGKNAAHRAAGLVHALPVDHAIRPRKVHVLEDARCAAAGWHSLLAYHAVPVEAHDFSRLDIAHVFGTNDVEPARFARHDPAAVIGELSDAQRPYPVRIAKHIEGLGACEHHGVGALEKFHRASDTVAQMVRRPGEEADRLCGNLGIGISAQLDALLGKAGAQRVGVHQRAVVGEREALVRGYVRLHCIQRCCAAARGVAHVTHRDESSHRGERRLVECLRYQAEAL